MEKEDKEIVMRFLREVVQPSMVMVAQSLELPLGQDLVIKGVSSLFEGPYFERLLEITPSSKENNAVAKAFRSFYALWRADLQRDLDVLSRKRSFLSVVLTREDFALAIAFLVQLITSFVSQAAGDDSMKNAVNQQMVREIEVAIDSTSLSFFVKAAIKLKLGAVKAYLDDMHSDDQFVGSLIRNLHGISESLPKADSALLATATITPEDQHQQQTQTTVEQQPNLELPITSSPKVEVLPVEDGNNAGVDDADGVDSNPSAISDSDEEQPTETAQLLPETESPLAETAAVTALEDQQEQVPVEQQLNLESVTESITSRPNVGVFPLENTAIDTKEPFDELLNRIAENPSAISDGDKKKLLSLADECFKLSAVEKSALVMHPQLSNEIAGKKQQISALQEEINNNKAIFKQQQEQKHGAIGSLRGEIKADVEKIKQLEEKLAAANNPFFDAAFEQQAEQNEDELFVNIRSKINGYQEKIVSLTQELEAAEQFFDCVAKNFSGDKESEVKSQQEVVSKLIRGYERQIEDCHSNVEVNEKILKDLKRTEIIQKYKNEIQSVQVRIEAGKKALEALETQDNDPKESPGTLEEALNAEMAKLNEEISALDSQQAQIIPAFNSATKKTQERSDVISAINQLVLDEGATENQQLDEAVENQESKKQFLERVGSIVDVLNSVNRVLADLLDDPSQKTMDDKRRQLIASSLQMAFDFAQQLLADREAKKKAVEEKKAKLLKKTAKKEKRISEINRTIIQAARERKPIDNNATTENLQKMKRKVCKVSEELQQARSELENFDPDAVQTCKCIVDSYAGYSEIITTGKVADYVRLHSALVRHCESLRKYVDRKNKQLGCKTIEEAREKGLFYTIRFKIVSLLIVDPASVNAASELMGKLNQAAKKIKENAGGIDRNNIKDKFSALAGVSEDFQEIKSSLSNEKQRIGSSLFFKAKNGKYLRYVEELDRAMSPAA